MRAERGLTLLEVLAAVALLGLFYTLLARAATQGFIAEGETRRRFEASLLADRKLAEIETLLISGQPLDEVELETEEDLYRIEVEIAPFPMPEAFADLELEADGVPSLFPEPDDPAEPPINQIDVTVSWFDGLGERAVRRTTLALDVVAIGETTLPEAAP